MKRKIFRVLITIITYVVVGGFIFRGGMLIERQNIIESNGLIYDFSGNLVNVNVDNVTFTNWQQEFFDLEYGNDK